MLYFNNHFNNFIANDKLILTNLDASDNLMISTLYKDWVSYLCRFLIIIWARRKKISLSAIRKLQLPLIKNSKQLIILKKLDVSTNNSRNQYISKVRVLKCSMQI